VPKLKLNKLEDKMSGISIKVKYFDKDMPRLEIIEKGDWIDLRSAQEIELAAGEYKLIPLGIAVDMPENCEAYIVSRSSIFKNYGIMQANGIGIVDECYKGDNDQWFYPAYATRDTKINKFDRIAQFRIQQKMARPVNIVEVEKMGNPDRSGFGTTGRK
jgi:dUTP pyrophosphatase